NEAEVGKGIKASGVNRDRIFVTTKVWPSNLGRKDFLPSVMTSLKKLEMDCVDLLLIHWPSEEVPLEESIGELIKAQEQGLTRFIGVSNFNVEMVEESLRLGAKLITNQVEYHPFLDQGKMLNMLRSNGLSLTAYSPIAQGKVMGNEILKSIGEKYGKSEVQVTLRWLIEQEGVMAIPRTSNLMRLSSNVEVFDFRLSEDDMEQINALHSQSGRLVDPQWAPEWD
ncbi:UNVERIFIED_CONTAM: hypothetical protein GTU68_003014, partial [Idotea baltica]|nr:hypothetical protein [Idotea baltica]